MRLTYLIPALLTLTIAPLFAGTSDYKSDKAMAPIETPFDKGKFELQSSSGVFFSVGSGDRPTLNYSSTAYRFGIMLYTPTGDGLFRGNTELLIQLAGASVFSDHPGNYLGIGSILLRYNFVQPDAKWVPYIQIGAGAVYSDIWKDKSQRLIGQPWEFDLEASLGLRYFFSNRWSAAVEGGYRHISNADSADRNVGLNSIGASVGLGYHF